MKPYTRGERISVAIQVAITELLNKKMQDPRVEMATISRVKISTDLRIADIYITVFGDKHRISETMEGFKNSKGFIKKKIAPKLGLKFMPELRFFHDDSFDKAAKMDALIQSAVAGDSSPDDK
jgi:ribosome-binding factor A